MDRTGPYLIGSETGKSNSCFNSLPVYGYMKFEDALANFGVEKLQVYAVAMAFDFGRAVNGMKAFELIAAQHCAHFASVIYGENK